LAHRRPVMGCGTSASVRNSAEFTVVCLDEEKESVPAQLPTKDFKRARRGWNNVSVPSPMPPLSTENLLQGVQTCIKDLEARVVARPSKTMGMADHDSVASLAAALKQLFSAPDFPDKVDWRVGTQPRLMSKLYVHQGEGVDVRVHLFEDVAETFCHNHKTSFFSCCLAGNYDHFLWDVVEDQAGSSHAEFDRTDDGQLVNGIEKPGKLTITHRSSHQAGLSYFIHAKTFHTVKASAGSSSVLTVAVRGRAAMAKTRVLADRLDIDWANPNVAEQDLQQEARVRVLKRMQEAVTPC